MLTLSVILVLGNVDAGTATSPHNTLLPQNAPSLPLNPTRGTSAVNNATETIDVLVLTVDFSDRPHTKTTLNVEDEMTTLQTYWSDVSYGKLSLRMTVTPKWYRLSETYVYYGTGSDQTSSKCLALINDALNVMGSNYDLKNYGTLIIVFAGNDETLTLNQDDMRSFGSRGKLTVSVSDTGSASVGIVAAAENDPVGPFAYNLGLTFGLSDLWDYDITKSSCPYCDDFVGEWDLMAHGYWSGNGTTPAWLSAYSLLQMGWLDSSQVTELFPNKTPSSDAVSPLESQNPHVIKIPLTDTTYYLVEARRRTGWDRNMYDDGVVIYYVDETKTSGHGIVRCKGQSGDIGKVWKPGTYFTDDERSLIIFVPSTDSNFISQISLYQGTGSKKYDLTVTTPFHDLSVEVDGKTYKTGASGDVFITGLTFGAYTITVEVTKDLSLGERGVFMGWGDGEGSNPRTVIIYTNTNITALYRKQFFLTLNSEAPVNGSGWYDENRQADFKANPIIDYGNGTRRLFSGWTGDYTGTDPTGAIAMTGPKSITANWKVQYQLTISSQYGNPIGGGWYDAGVTIAVSVPPSIDTDSGVRKRFTGWSGDITGESPNVTVLMDHSKTIITDWLTQYLILLQFTDANNQPLQPPPVAQFEHSGKNTTITIPPGQNGQQMWLDEGNYTLRAAKWQGADIANVGAIYSTGPMAVWQVRMRVSSMTVHVQSIMTGLPIQGAVILVKLSDNTTLTATTDISGRATFQQLPSGQTYPATVNSQFLAQTFTLTINDSNTETTVRIPVTLEIGVTVLIIVGAAIVVVRKLSGPNKKKKVKQNLNEYEEAQTPPRREEKLPEGDNEEKPVLRIPL